MEQAEGQEGLSAEEILALSEGYEQFCVLSNLLLAQKVKDTGQFPTSEDWHLICGYALARCQQRDEFFFSALKARPESLPEEG